MTNFNVRRQLTAWGTVATLLVSLPAAAAPVALDATRTLGPVGRYGHLTVFPILATYQPAVGTIVSLDAAQAKGQAVVTEVKGESEGAARTAAPRRLPPQSQQRTPPGAWINAPNRLSTSDGTAAASQVRAPSNVAPEQVQQMPIGVRGDGAQVNTLVIANTGKAAVLVLAGTIVKGGKQDRQIGQDFVVEPGKTVPVDAFCVERGRWNPQRAGKATDGIFKASNVLANQEVRVAGQYERDQSQVWSKVSAINAATGNTTNSDTLLATLESKTVQQERADLAAKILAHFDRLPNRAATVGLAYGIDGRVKSVRWFATHALFTQFRQTLVNTAAVDAVTARLVAKTSGEAATTPQAVAAFVAGVALSPEAERKTTAAGNVNVYRKHETGYGSQTTVRRQGTERVVTADFQAK